MYPICIRQFLREWLLCADSYFLLASQRHNTMVCPHSYSPCHPQSIQGSGIKYFRTLNCFFTHLWFYCLVKGSSCFAPCTIRFSLHVSLFPPSGDSVFVTFPADLHHPQISKGLSIVWFMLVITKHTFTPKFQAINRLKRLWFITLWKSQGIHGYHLGVVCCMGYVVCYLHVYVCILFSVIYVTVLYIFHLCNCNA